MTHPGLDLYWIPLGAGARVVQTSGRVYEALCSRIQRRPASPLFHSALVAHVDGDRYVIEMTPIPSPRRAEQREVVAEGPVGVGWLRRIRIFRYEIRRWREGVIPDVSYAVASPVRITGDTAAVRRVLELVPSVPTPVWGRDELRTGDMWNSNSVVSWLLARTGLDGAAGNPPAGGRAPGWEAGVAIARRQAGSAPTQGRAAA